MSEGYFVIIYRQKKAYRWVDKQNISLVVCINSPYLPLFPFCPIPCLIKEIKTVELMLTIQSIRVEFFS